MSVAPDSTSANNQKFDDLKQLLALQRRARQWDIKIDFKSCIAKAIAEENSVLIDCFAEEQYDFGVHDNFVYALKYMSYRHVERYIEQAGDTYGLDSLISTIACYERDEFLVIKNTVYACFLAYLTKHMDDVRAYTDDAESDSSMLVEVGCKFDCLDDFLPFYTQKSLCKDLTAYAQCCSTVYDLERIVVQGYEFDKTLKAEELWLDNIENDEDARKQYARMYALGFRLDSFFLASDLRGVEFLRALHRVKYGSLPREHYGKKVSRKKKDTSFIDSLAAKYLERAEFNLVSHRICEIVRALRDLPALVLLYIVDADHIFASLVSIYVKYSIITTCKHFGQQKTKK